MIEKLSELHEIHFKNMKFSIKMKDGKAFINFNEQFISINDYLKITNEIVKKEITNNSIIENILKMGEIINYLTYEIY